MEYVVGDKLQVEGVIYTIIGKVKYKNRNDGLIWVEYRLISEGSGAERWLSYDEYYKEFSISQIVNGVDTTDYHVVDRGVEEVVGACGNVDVEDGDRANFIEYEDITEEKIISLEQWSDGEETCTGHYVELSDIKVISNNNKGSNTLNVRAGSGRKKSKAGSIFLVVFFLIIFGGMPVLTVAMENHVSDKAIRKYISSSTTKYKYVSSITGNNGEKADVYSSTNTIDATVKDIIKGIDGKTTDVSQNNDSEDGSVVIMTKKEHCLVYTSEEGDTLVQVSSRKYVYSTNKAPYRSRALTHRYYRRHYYSKGYSSDSSTFGTGSAYDDFDDSKLSSNEVNTSTYNTYSSSVRQASVSSRSSSGGGTSSGK